MISVLAESDVLKLLVRKMVGRRDGVLHLRPVHDGARPPESRHVVRILEHDLLDLVDEPLALGRVEGSRVPCEEIVARGVALEEQIGIVHVVEGERKNSKRAFAVATPCPLPPPGATIAPPAAEVKRRREGEAPLRRGAPSTTRLSWRYAERGQAPERRRDTDEGERPVRGRGDGGAGPVTATLAAATATAPPQRRRSPRVCTPTSRRRPPRSAGTERRPGRTPGAADG